MRGFNIVMAVMAEEKMKILKKVEEMLRNHLDLSSDEVVEEKTLIVDDLGADSLDVVELIMQLEKEFDVKISDEEAKSLKTVGDVVDALVEKGVDLG